MKLKEIAAALGLEQLVALGNDGVEIASGHASDLLSDVLANAPAGGLLLTLQVHMNVVAVALHAGLSAVVFTSGMMPDAAVMQKAAEEKLALYRTPDTTFETAGRLYALGLRGAHG